MKTGQKVAILGASTNPDRYSYKALKKLQNYDQIPFPINPKLSEVEGVKCFASIEDLSKDQKEIDTLTLYVNPGLSSPLLDQMIKLRPKRIIFNPGSENSALYEELEQNGIEVLEACTLVLLSTDQF